MEINSYQALLSALRQRHDFFASMDCRVSDHGLEQIYAEDYTDSEIAAIFNKIRGGQALHQTEILKLKSALLVECALMDHEKGWTQQYHLGALRNNNSQMLRLLGPIPAGIPSVIFPWPNPCPGSLTGGWTHELFATMIGNFNDGSIPGKMQFGSGWWFLDQKDGMERQLNALSNMGLLSRFVGMLTDSRSFLSYPRHEYFRRILCNMLGNDVENGELPEDRPWLGQVVENICYYNAKAYFGFEIQ